LKFAFSDLTAVQVLELVQNGLGGKDLAKILKFDLSPDALTVSISKFGTSELVFSYKEKASGGVHFDLAHQKIAFAHRAYQGDVMEKLAKIITDAGGKIKES
jgi:hypothetical protein